jgi:hypothetical protein
MCSLLIAFLGLALPVSRFEIVSVPRNVSVPLPPRSTYGPKPAQSRWLLPCNYQNPAQSCWLLLDGAQWLHRHYQHAQKTVTSLNVCVCISLVYRLLKPDHSLLEILLHSFAMHVQAVQAAKVVL